jgi:hypothetical protein
MKLSYSKFASTFSVVLLLMTLASQSYASVLINFTTSDGQHGYISCGSSAGPYAMLCSGNGPCTDVTEQWQGIVNFACGNGSGDESQLEMLISDIGRRPSDGFILRYPLSYNLTAARLVKDKQLKSTAWAPFVGDGTVNGSTSSE